MADSAQPRRGGYDYDVVVVGGGPAGLAAATRVRWVKGYRVLVGSVCIVESGPPGGLLSWGSCVLTGPSWAYSGIELADQLMADIERLHIPIVRDLVTRVDVEGPYFVSTLRSGRSLRSLSVVLATGFRPLANEHAYYQRGLRITYKGYDLFPSIVSDCAAEAGARGLVVVGNEKTSHLDDVLRTAAGERTPVTVVHGDELVEVYGVQRVEGVRRRNASGAVEEIPCGAVLMDYNAMEILPSFVVRGIEPRLDGRGFVEVDARMRTSIDGVYAAGDITGRYASTLMALGDGVCAGFGAYEHSFRRKFGRAPSLFAYRGTDAPVPLEPTDIPPIPDHAVPVALGDGPDWIENGLSLSELARSRKLTASEVRMQLNAAVLNKHITYHCLAGEGRVEST